MGDKTAEGGKPSSEGTGDDPGKGASLPDGKSVEFHKAEAEKAIAAREKAKARVSELQSKLDEFEKKEKERLEKEALAKGEHEKVIADLKVKVEQFEKENTTIGQAIKTFLELEFKSIPEERRTLIPEALSPVEQLQYISKNRALLHGTKGKIGGSTKPNEGTPAEAKTFAELVDQKMNDPKKSFRERAEELSKAALAQFGAGTGES